jgi:hypothetical protein
MTPWRATALLAGCAVLLPCLRGAAGDGGGVTIDKEKRLIKIDARVAPRKLPGFKEVYPIEVIASWPHPKGKKAHETVVTIEANPSAVHKALEGFGLKPGKPVMGDSKEPPQGPEVNLYLEVAGPDGAPRKLTMDRVLRDPRNGKPFPKTVRWRFTGSALVKLDPANQETAYGADLSGTLISIFPVTDQTVFQTNLTMEYEKFMRLETNTDVLPKEGTAVKLVIEVPKAK